jgi:hypothetical protein
VPHLLVSLRLSTLVTLISFTPITSFMYFFDAGFDRHDLGRGEPSLSPGLALGHPTLARSARCPGPLANEQRGWLVGPAVSEDRLYLTDGRP